MPEIICDTSPIQYLYQLKLLHILSALAQRVIVPPAVVDELAAGRALGVSLPNLSVSSPKLAPYWINFRLCVSASLHILARQSSNSPEKWTTTVIDVSGKEIHIQHVEGHCPVGQYRACRCAVAEL